MNLGDIGSWASIVGIPLSIIALAVSYYLYRKSRNLKRISYYSKSIKIIDNIPNDSRLKLRFDDQDIKRIVLTKIAIWNSGDIEIDYSDFSSENYLNIIYSNPELILETYRLYSDNISGLCFKKSDYDSVLPIFNHIDPGEGFILQIMHGGSLVNWGKVTGILKNKRKNKVLKIGNISSVSELAGDYSKLFTFLLLISLPMFSPYLNRYIEVIGFDEKTDFVERIIILVSGFILALAYLSFTIRGNLPGFRLLAEKLSSAPTWLEEMNSDDWAVSEENIVDWT